MLVLTLLACANGDLGPEETDSGLPSSPFEVPATWTADEAFSELERAYGMGIPQPGGMALVYEEALGHRDPGADGCPSLENPDSTEIWGTWYSMGCTTTDGWTFYGTASAYRGSSVSEGETTDSLGGLASWEITDPQGQLFVGGGSFGMEAVTGSDGVTTWESIFGGTWSYPPADDWMGDGVHTSLFFDGESVGDQFTLVVDGGVEHSGSDLHYNSVRFERGACGGWPQGDLRVRDPGAAWFTFTFGDSCDGCGELLLPGGTTERRCMSESLADMNEHLFSSWALP